ncbi:SxtJ family membrane protein [candidate division KSB1 bacterium]
MLIEEIRNIKSGKNELRKFALTVGVLFGLLGGLFYWIQKDYYFYFLIIFALLISSGLIIPVLLKPIQKIWMIFTVILGWFITRLILCILFYFIVTPISIILRLSGKDLLNREFDKHADSYWIPRKNKISKNEGYEKQF